MAILQRSTSDADMRKAREFSQDPRIMAEVAKETKDQWVKGITPESARVLSPSWLSAKYEVLRSGKLVGDARKAFFVLIGELERRAQGRTIAISFNDGTKKTATIEGINVTKGALAEKDLPFKLLFADGTRTELSWNQTLEVQPSSAKATEAKKAPATKVVVEEEVEKLANKKAFTEERIAAGIARGKQGKDVAVGASPDKKNERLLALNTEWKGKTVVRLDENGEKTYWHVDGVIGALEGAEVLLVGIVKGRKATKKEEIGDFVLKNRYSESHDTNRLAQEAQARFARRIGTSNDTLQWISEGKTIRKYKIIGVISGSDNAPVLLQDPEGGKPFSIGALTLDGYEKLAAALVDVNTVSKVERVAIPVRVEQKKDLELTFKDESKKPSIKVRVGVADVSQGLAGRSRDVGEASLHREPKETNFFSRAWRYMFSEGSRQSAIGKSRSEKLSARDVYAGEGLTKAESDAAKMAIVERIQDETEEMLHKEGKNGEARKKFGDSTAEVAVKRSLDGLIREFVKGVMTPEELNKQKDAIFAQANKLAGDAKGDGVMYVDNLEEIAGQVKKASEIAGGLQNLTIDLELTIGRAKIGARTERDRSMVDRALDSLSTYGASGAFGSGVARVFHNEIGVTLGVMVGMGVVAKGLGLGKLRLLSAGLSSGLSGMFSYWKEKELLNQERSLTERQSAEGGVMKRDESSVNQAQRKNELEQKAQLEAQRDALPWHAVMDKLRLNKKIAELDNAGQPRRELMEKYSLARVRSQDALTTMKYGLDGTTLRAGTDFASATRVLAHIEARVRLSNKGNVDFIQYSKPALVEKERNEIEVTRATLKHALRNAFATDVTIDKAVYPTFDDYYKAMYALEDNENRKTPTTELEKAQQESAKKFGEYTHRQGKESAKKTIVLGFIFGAMFQEIAAGFQDHVTGLWDEMMGNHVAGAETTLFATPIGWLRNYLGAGAPTGPIDYSHIEQIGSNLVSLSHGTEILHQADGTDALVNTLTGKVMVPDLHLANGILDASSIQALKDAGIMVHESEVVTNSVSNLTKNISMTDWFKEHLIYGETAVRHWMGNDTPMHWNADHTKLLGADFNEIELKAAQTASGLRSWFDNNGNGLWRIPGMTADGSFQGGHHADVIAALKTGHAELWITPDSHYPDHLIKVAFNSHGVATIPGGSSQVDLLYHVVNGKMEFVGDRAEVVITGTGNHVDVLATYLGLDSAQPTLVENVGKAVTHHVTGLVNSPEAFVSPTMATFIPIPLRGRVPLERLGKKRGGYKDVSVDVSVDDEVDDDVSTDNGVHDDVSIDNNVDDDVSTDNSVHDDISVDSDVEEDISVDDNIEEEVEKKAQESGEDSDPIFIDDNDGKEKKKDVKPELSKAEIQNSLSAMNQYVETWTPEYHSLVESLVQALPSMSEECRMSIALPAYAERNIYETLRHYVALQKDGDGKPLDPQIFDLTILLNRPNTSVPFDQNTLKEIKRFNKDYPNYHVHVAMHTFDFPEKVSMGEIYKLAADSMMMRSLNRQSDLRKARQVFRTGGADAREKNPKMIGAIIHEFENDPSLEQIRTEVRQPKEVLERLPLFHVASSVNSGMSRLYTRGKSNVGLGTYSAKLYAMAGGFNSADAVQEEVNLGKKMRKIVDTSSAEMTDRTLHIKNAIEDPRRGLYQMYHDVPLAFAYRDFDDKELNKAVRAFPWEKEIQKDIPPSLELTPENLTRELSAIFQLYLKRALKSGSTSLRLEKEGKTLEERQKAVKALIIKKFNTLFWALGIGKEGKDYTFTTEGPMNTWRIEIKSLDKVQKRMKLRNFKYWEGYGE